MYSLTPEQFRQKAAQGNLIPIYAEILADMETPVSAFRKIEDQSYAFLLESVEGGEKWARYSFIGYQPSVVFRVRGAEVEIERDGKIETRSFESDPLEVIKLELSRYKPVVDSTLPRFFGGVVGYLGYDMVKTFEEISDDTVDDLELPDAVLVLANRLFVFDNVNHKIKVVVNVEIPESSTDTQLEQLYTQAQSSIQEMISHLSDAASAEHLASDSDRTNPSAQAHPVQEAGFNGVVSNVDKEQFESGVSKVIEYIKAGDAIQVVVSQRFSRNTSADAFDVYRALRTINPSPYMYFLNFGEVRVAGSSPEVLVRLEGDEIELRPIAGTSPRGKDDAEDEQIAKKLLDDPKERAEHVMLVDLGRNDVGRVAETSSVRVDELMVIEKYSHVMHIVSNVRGVLRSGCDMFDVLRSCFPAGTLSGAPKVRAMEIIEEIEPTKRGPYGGAVGFFGFSGNMDMCITIRTIVILGDRAYVQAGAGIVADSVPEKEYLETINKARGMVKAIEIAEQGLRG